MRLKYILDEYGNFALFSEANAHNDIAKGFYQKPESAGFCKVLVGSNTETKAFVLYVECYGESISLNLKSRPEDSEIITKKLNGYE